MSRKWAIDVEDINTKETFMVFFVGDQPPSDEQQKKSCALLLSRCSSKRELRWC